MSTIHTLVSRIRAEYLEMPDLRLTIQQVQRLCGIERALCQTVLDALVDARFLCVKSDGAYARLTDDTYFVRGPVKAVGTGDKRVATAS